MADELRITVEDEVFTAILEYLEEHHWWKELEGDELAEFKIQMVEEVFNNPSKIHNVEDVDVEQLSELTCGEPIIDLAETYSRYWYYVGGCVIKENWEGVLLRWKHYSRPFSSDEEDEEELVCPKCGRTEEECERNAESETNPITHWCGGWGLSCDDCYYKNHPESDEEDQV
jgi:hypothetical protein